MIQERSLGHVVLLTSLSMEKITHLIKGVIMLLLWMLKQVSKVVLYCIVLMAYCDSLTVCEPVCERKRGLKIWCFYVTIILRGSQWGLPSAVKRPKI